jgi:spoIIIJ-associated protein
VTDEGSLEAPVVEAEGETVGEAKWNAMRELERRYPGLAREAVTFQVVSEGQRGLLGIGTSPARVVASFDAAIAPPPAAPSVEEPAAAPVGEGEAALVHELLDRISRALGADCRIDVEDRGQTIAASLSGPGVAVLIGKRGKTIDAIQYLVGAAVATAGGADAPRVTVDAAGYRDRREARLVDLADRSAQQALRTGATVRLEPMTSAERKIVHLHLKGTDGIETHSEGDEPNRYVVITPGSPPE